jgi:hypothetical protein
MKYLVLNDSVLKIRDIREIRGSESSIRLFVRPFVTFVI